MEFGSVDCRGIRREHLLRERRDELGLPPAPAQTMDQVMEAARL